MPIIGTWRGPMQIDQAEVGKFVDAHGADYVVENVISRCPTRVHLPEKGREIAVDDANCVHCMHCLNVMHKALRPGKDKGVTILLGGKRTLKIGDTMSSVLIPFMKLETEEDLNKLTELVERIWEFWTEHGLDHERVGEFIDRVGLGTFLEGVGIEPDPPDGDSSPAPTHTSSSRNWRPARWRRTQEDAFRHGQGNRNPRSGCLGP